MDVNRCKAAVDELVEGKVVADAADPLGIHMSIYTSRATPYSLTALAATALSRSPSHPV